jgi:hypothetical protein
MSIKEILEELPNLTQEEKRQLWNVLNHEVAHDVEEGSPLFGERRKNLHH